MNKKRFFALASCALMALLSGCSSTISAKNDSPRSIVPPRLPPGAIGLKGGPGGGALISEPCEAIGEDNDQKVCEIVVWAAVVYDDKKAPQCLVSTASAVILAAGVTKVRWRLADGAKNDFEFTGIELDESTEKRYEKPAVTGPSVEVLRVPQTVGQSPPKLMQAAAISYTVRVKHKKAAAECQPFDPIVVNQDN